MEIINLFKTILIIMLFYSFGITLLAHNIPDEAKDYFDPFTDVGQEMSIEEVGSQVQGNLDQQTNIPVIELGALVFYSGNIFVDLILNFLFAIPQMLGILLNGLLFLFGFDSYIIAYIELFTTVLFSVMYFIGIITLIIGVRSGRMVS